MKQLAALIMLAGGAFSQTVQVHGHRGARAMRPENTMPAFEYAIAQGVDALELDMAVTKDAVVVVSHDPDLRAPICTRPRDRAAIPELTFAQQRQSGCGAERKPLVSAQPPLAGTQEPNPA